MNELARAAVIETPGTAERQFVPLGRFAWLGTASVGRRLKRIAWRRRRRRAVSGKSSSSSLPWHLASGCCIGSHRSSSSPEGCYG